MCKAYQVLPRPGGLLDQDALFVHLATVVEAATNEREAEEHRRSKANMPKMPRMPSSRR